MKHEEIYLRAYETVTHARQSLATHFDFISVSDLIPVLTPRRRMKSTSIRCRSCSQLNPQSFYLTFVGNCLNEQLHFSVQRILRHHLRVGKPMAFLKSNKLFSFLYPLSVLVSFGVIYKLGFGEAVSQIASQPERLRDITFHIWDNYAPSQHGYLVFYSLDNFREKIAYSNHSTAYLFYMYMLYKIEMLIPALQMRVIGAFLNMLSLAGTVFFIISRLVEERIGFAKSLLTLLSVVFMASMPDFWISSARFNVDNTFPLIFAFHVLVAFFIWQDKGKGKRVVVSTLLFALFSPISAAILGASLLLYSIQRDGLDTKLSRLAVLATLSGAVFYVQAPIVAKVLGFASSNSGWLFRAGLDGDTRYFSNIWESVFAPQSPRPLHIIAVPVLFLLIQMAYFRVRKYLRKTMEGEDSIAPVLFNANIFYYLIFSQYLFACLFWPQAVAIHPYLYDYLLLAPLCVLIVLNFLTFSAPSFFQFWLLALLFCISFNLQQIALSKCTGCSYPAWEIKR